MSGWQLHLPPFSRPLDFPGIFLPAGGTLASHSRQFCHPEPAAGNHLLPDF